MKAVFLVTLTILMQIVQIMSAFLSLKFAGQFLPVEYMAVWILYFCVLPFLVLLDGNLSVTLAREISFSNKLKYNIRRVTNLINSSDYIVNYFLSISLLLATIIFILYFMFKDDIQTDIFYPTCIFIFSLMIKVKSNYAVAKVFALNLLIQDRIIKIISILLHLLLVYIFLNKNFALYSLGISYLIQASLTTMFCYFIIKKNYSFENIGKIYGRVTKRLLLPTKEYMFIAIPGILVLNSGIYYLKFNASADDIIISYGLATQVLVSVMGLGMIIPSTFQPIISKAFAVNIGYKFKAITLIKNYYIVVFGIMYNLLIFKEEFFNLWIGHCIDNRVFHALFIVYFFEMIQAPATIFCVAIGYFKFAKITMISSLLILCCTYPVLRLCGELYVPILILVVQLLTCHQYNIRKFIHKFDISSHDLVMMFKEIFAPVFLIVVIVTIIYHFMTYANILKIVASALFTLIIIFILSYKDLQRISNWLKN